MAVVLSDCQKKVDIIIEPTTFQVTACCKNDTMAYCRLAYVLNNVKGRLYRNSADVETYRVILDDFANIYVPTLPNWRYWGLYVVMCNMPKELYQKANGVPVLISCKLQYVPAFKDGIIPQSDGYPAELTAIELIK